MPEVARLKGVGESGYRTVVNTGPDSAATVGHLHVHVLGGMVIDGSMVGIGRLSEAAPMTVHLENGRLTAIEGGDETGPYAERLAVLFAATRPSGITSRAVVAPSSQPAA